MHHRPIQLLLICVIVILAIYFRVTYLGGRISDQAIEKMAVRHVKNEVRNQLLRNIQDALRGVSSEEREQILNRETDAIVSRDREQYQKLLMETRQALAKEVKNGRSRPYLLESDPYFYYHLVQRIDKSGRLSDVVKNGKFFDPDREWPHGAWTPVTWHPYLGYWWSRIIRGFASNQDLLEALCSFSLLLVLVSILCFLYLGRFFQVSSWIWLAASSILAFAPIYVQRSAYGWFDTDPYQFIFPSLILALSLKAYSAKNGFPALLFAGFLTGMYGMFWGGWFFIFILITSGLLVEIMVSSIIANQKDHKFQFNKLLWYVISSFGFACLFLTPAGFFESVSHGFLFVKKYSLTDQDVWPNPFLTVGEASPTSVKKLVYLACNPLSMSIGLIGLISMFSRSIRTREPKSVFIAATISIYFIGAAVAALQTERFAILFVLPVAVAVAHGIYAAHLVFKKYAMRLSVWLSAGLILVLLSFSSVYAYVSGRFNIPQIMNDTWYESFQFLRNQTPSNSVVNSWWPPGYFIASLAERKILIDGGTQQLPQTYWIAKALSSSDEREMIGIVRMLNVSGNDALKFLLERGYDTARGTNLLLKLVKLRRSDARVFDMPLIGAEDREVLLDLVFGKGEPLPAYLYLYNDMIEQNLALTLMANWDFEKAKLAKHPQKQSGISNYFGKGAFQNYVDETLAITGPVWKYLPEVFETGRRENVISFSNGMELDRAGTTVKIPGPDSPGVRSEPYSVFSEQNGRLTESISTANDRVDVSVLIWEQNGQYHGVLASRPLIQSMMFRLYYLHGKGMRYAEQVYEKESAVTKMRILIFRINWAAFGEE